MGNNTSTQAVSLELAVQLATLRMSRKRLRASLTGHASEQGGKLDSVHEISS